MKLLIPLGFLGLLGLIVLLLIYILKPNYQQKVISSTFIWNLSLKYRKKRIPVSKLRNILILLCQILIIVCAALILTQPVIVTSAENSYEEKIFVIDASANMSAKYEEETRFSKAISAAKNEAESLWNRDGYVTVIWAGPTAETVVLRADKTEKQTAIATMDSLEYSYGTGDIDAAMDLVEDLLKTNPETEVVFYTGTRYSNEGNNVRVEYVCEAGEWNAAILSASAVMEDNYYEFTVQLACYGLDKTIDVYCELTNVNGGAGTATLPLASVDAIGDETMTVVYSVNSSSNGYNTTNILLDTLKIYSFDEMFVYILEDDAISTDNEYYVYGATRPTIKIEYYTTSPNPFYRATLRTLKSQLADTWSIEITEIKSGAPELEGYDFYLFEGTMPDKLPTDGVVLMANPDQGADAGFTVSRVVDISNYNGDGEKLAPGIEHPIMNYVDVDYLQVTQYAMVDEMSLDADYQVLMYYQSNPVFFVRNTDTSKVGVIAFGVKNSTFNIQFFTQIILRNFFDYYFTSTFENTTYDIYDTITFTPRGTDLQVTYEGEEQELTGVDGNELYVTKPGTYTVSQMLISGLPMEEKIYITIPKTESNITRTVDSLTNPYVERKDTFTFDDLLLYFAASIVALLFIEWLLQTREGI